MATTSRFQENNFSYLSGGVAGYSSSTLVDDATYRRYRAGLTIGTYEHGSYTYSRRSIFYEVGRHFSGVTKALAYNHADDDALEIDASIPINSVEAANFEGWARKYSNFSPQWHMMDLCAVVERLGKAVAAQSVFGGVTTAHLRGGQPIRAVALGTLDSPQTASTNSVFIPRTVDSVGNDKVFSVLAAAVNGEGSTVTTDVLRLDAATNSPIMPECSGHGLAKACVEALRVLGANFEASGAGDLFAYALTRGIHSGVSVVAHTDEGGWFRNVLRACHFRPPYGGINLANRDYPFLPPLAAEDGGATSAWVDSIALKTAALVAHCDPCTHATGGAYPTIFVANDGAVQPVGTHEPAGTERDAASLGGQIAADVSRFAPLYMRGLVKLFGLRANSGVAESHFSTVANVTLSGTKDRHLRHKTVAPYFFIEPTSLIEHRFLGSPAEEAGFGALTSPGAETELATFERVRELDRGKHANFCTIAFKMRTARTSGLVAAYAGTPAELAGLRLYQFDEASVVLPGDLGPTAGTVSAKHANADPLSSYLWKRGQSPIPAPAEFVNIQGSYAAKYHVVTWDDDFDATVSDLPEAWELESHPTKWRVSVPTAIRPGATNASDNGARRARCRAAIALAQTVIRSRGLGDANSPCITVSNTPPSWDDPVQPMARKEDTLHHPGVGTVSSFAEGNPPPAVPAALGPPLAPTLTHQPLRGAPLPRHGGGVVTGPPPTAAVDTPVVAPSAPPSVDPRPDDADTATAGPAPRI
ncbi:coat protein [Ustilaginoidea virens RNA virus 3]|uniref:Coat protein n=1 Tax=Ustilaginoidea virens RNA virus 3 TaxID=1460374 RepID=W5TYK1_9VIRU|nr:coat protein [Ustilaginoidea virens RNA virus 3]AHH25154.1 coat protein [Ustilaginoidea virens RNA virus 3]